MGLCEYVYAHTFCSIKFCSCVQSSNQHPQNNNTLCASNNNCKLRHIASASASVSILHFSYVKCVNLRVSKSEFTQRSAFCIDITNSLHLTFMFISVMHFHYANILHKFPNSNSLTITPTSQHNFWVLIALEGAPFLTKSVRIGKDLSKKCQKYFLRSLLF